MKNLHFALCGMVILLAAMLFALASCSFDETNFEGQPEVESSVTGDSEADEVPPVENDGPSSGDDSPTVDDPTAGDNSPDEEEPDESPNSSLPDDDPPDDPSLNVLAMRINELRTEYNGNTSRAEFIEFKILSAGNLGGLRVFVASNVSNPLIYEFLPVEVKAGEYVVLHLRTLDDSSVDELGSDLNESGGRDASPDARDFWIPGNTKLLRKTDAVYIMDQDDRILDAVMIAESPIPPRSMAFFLQAAEFLFTNDAWKSANGTIPGVEDAVNSTAIGTALTRSISRDETVPDTDTAADWYITANNGATPGRENDPRRL
jgi:hypothetical protein